MLDEESIRSGSTVSASSTVAGNASSSTPVAPAGSSTSLAPGPVELGALEANSGPKRSRCARCGRLEHWSPVCHTPQDWKETDPKVGEGMAKKGSGKDLKEEEGTTPKEEERGVRQYGISQDRVGQEKGRVLRCTTQWRRQVEKRTGAGMKLPRAVGAAKGKGRCQGGRGKLCGLARAQRVRREH